jgi:hypothetical protein
MLDQIDLKDRKQKFRSQMCLPLKDVCETSWCLVCDGWSNDESDSVIVLIVAVVSLVELVPHARSNWLEGLKTKI